ncbi:hypothetical protein [Leucobacter salsicius]|uniref:hypothetical protein n=1 Tax=Leucobacter salsicius TaxID=664638 RepID=UPI00034BD127|nr:hypothetical protein [Leucobacter salsicius]
MKKKTSVAIAVTGALIAGAAATGVIFHQHNQSAVAFDEAHTKLAEKVGAVQNERDTAAKDLTEAKAILDRASQPGALAQTASRADLDVAVDRAIDQFAEYDDLLAEPEKALAEAEGDRPFWRGDLDAAAETLLEQFYALSATNTPRISLGPVRPVQAELNRTADIVAIEEKIASTPAAQDSSGSYRPAAEKLATDAGFTVHQISPSATVCGGYPVSDQAAALVCAESGPEIFIIDGRTEATDPYLDAAIRHEIAHQMIFQRCGTANPPEAGDRFEAVTHSYAELYLGADRAQLDATTSDEYTITPESDAAARQIHDAGCAA